MFGKFTKIAVLVVVLSFVADVRGEAKIGTTSKNVSLETWIAPKEIAAKFPYYISGFDHDNRPIYVMEMGKWDLRTTIDGGGKDLENLEIHIDKFFYQLEQGGKNYPNGEPKGTEDVVSIVDWENFSLLQLASGPTVQFFLKRFSGFQRIQEKLAYGYFINVNSVANTLINLARPVMGSVMERIEVYGTQKDRWVPRLLRKIPKNQLPSWYGGDEKFTPVATFG